MHLEWDWWWFSGLVAKWCPTVCDSMDCRPQFPLFMGFARQGYGSGFVNPPPGIFCPRDWTCVSYLTGGFFTAEPPGKPQRVVTTYLLNLTELHGMRQLQEHNEILCFEMVPCVCCQFVHVQVHTRVHTTHQSAEIDFILVPRIEKWNSTSFSAYNVEFMFVCTVSRFAS